MKDIYLIGGGGHSVSCIDVIESTNQFRIKGLFDQKERVGQSVMSYPIIGTDQDVEKYVVPGVCFLVTLGQIKSPDLRMRVYDQLVALGAQLATVISPRAYVAKSAKIGAGTIVMHDCLVNAAAVVGVNCILNSKALVEHGAEIADHCHISTAAVVNGNAIVSLGSFIGSNAVLIEGARVEARSVIPAGQFCRIK